MIEARLPDEVRQSRQFLILYALAAAGGSIAYVPFLTIILPAQVSAFAGAQSLQLLAYVAFFGAISASVSNIFFGWLSDITKTRRPWVAAGLLFANLLLVMASGISHPIALIALIIGWQLCLNMMLAPLSAWAGDCVPDAQKGLLGGLLALAPALGALSGVLVTWEAVIASDARLYWVAALTILCVGPVLLFGRPRPITELATDRPAVDRADDIRFRLFGSPLSRMWIARLLVQIAEAALFAFLLLWFRSIDPGFGENRVAAVFTAVLAVAVLFALVVGRWSDARGKPILPLTISACLVATGLGLMSIAQGLELAIVGYIIFGLASSVFLALHTSQTLRVLPRAQRRGRDLGLFNLTNTVPSLIMPWLTLALVPVYGFDALFILLATLALLAAFLLWRMPD